VRRTHELDHYRISTHRGFWRRILWTGARRRPRTAGSGSIDSRPRRTPLFEWQPGPRTATEEQRAVILMAGLPCSGGPPFSRLRGVVVEQGKVKTNIDEKRLYTFARWAN